VEEISPKESSWIRKKEGWEKRKEREDGAVKQVTFVKGTQEERGEKSKFSVPSDRTGHERWSKRGGTAGVQG